MKTLLIFIPTYNREQSLRLCLERLLAQVGPVQDRVAIHISDNHSTDGTAAYLASLSHPCLTHSRNPVNVGAARNVLKALTLREVAAFTWIIGDDDYMLPEAPARLVREIDEHPQIDFYFLNTRSFEERHRAAALAGTPGGWFAKGHSHTRIGRDFDCSLHELFEPRIDPVFLGAVMCYAFRSNRVTDRISEKITVTDLTQVEACYPHTLAWLQSFDPKTPCRHLYRPFTINIWHEGTDWGVNGYDWAVTHGLGHVLYEAIRLGHVEPARRDRLLAHYLAMARQSYIKLSGDAPGRKMPFSPSFKDELLELLLTQALTRQGMRPKLRSAAKRIIAALRPSASMS